LGDIDKLLSVKLIGLQTTNAGVAAVMVVLGKIIGDAGLGIG